MFRSEFLAVMFSIVKILTILICIIHLICCFWYGLGVMPTGWVDVLGVRDQTLWDRYVTSYHWSITQFVGSSDLAPANPNERTFAVVVLLVAFVITVCAVSVLTSSMTQLQIIGSRHVTQLAVL